MSTRQSPTWQRKLRSGNVYAEFQEERVPDVDISILLDKAAHRHAVVYAQINMTSGDFDANVRYVRDEGSDVQEFQGPSSTRQKKRALNNEVGIGQSSSIDAERPQKARRLQKGPSTTPQGQSDLLKSPHMPRRQSHTNEKRARKRQEKKMATRGELLRSTPQHFRMPELATFTFQMEKMRSKGDGYTAKTYKPDSEPFLGPADRAGIRIVQNDGSQNIPIVEKGQHVIAVAVPPPKDDRSFLDACDGLHAEILRQGSRLSASAGAKQRGGHLALAGGITYGLGQPFPQRLKYSSLLHEEIMEALLRTMEAKRIAGFQSCVFGRWSPANERWYATTKQFISRHPKTQSQRWNFLNSVFASTTINFGPRTWTYRHCDVQNLPHGWCAVTAMGQYDYTKGGHLILWDLKLAIEFPPGCTILLPSATIAHSNVPVGSSETRTSFTQYSAGPIFRWVTDGGRNLRELQNEDEEGYLKCRAALNSKSGLAGYHRFATLEELLVQQLIIP
ncbi:hypothetical protein VNI00_018786 [Paramarasmius palmivorus]|uniref:Uncharacterized protein n=1 Tax=Paramarasmius palmivorus TaxID=297713 RepID=A0AAW0AVR3_9AGAR